MKNCKINEKNDLIVITLPTIFDYKQHESLRGVYLRKDPGSTYEIDFKHVGSVQSSSLAIFLLLKEHNGSEKGEIRFINCSEDVLKVMKFSKFDKSFSIAALS